jgi:hypothetical protein
MASVPLDDPDVRAAVEEAVRELVSVRHWGRASFVSVPLFGPDGSPITVRVTHDIAGFRVDDAGFTYRDLKRLGIERSFGKTAASIAEREDVAVVDHALQTVAGPDELARAISDVGIASWNILDKIHAKLSEVDEAEMQEELRQRLASIFGGVDDQRVIPGMSTTPWNVSAILHVDGKLAVFQAVSDHANSIYRVSAAFHDLASLPEEPTLVSVVRSKAALGAKLGILAQAGRVIEEHQSDQVYRRAVA